MSSIRLLTSLWDVLRWVPMPMCRPPLPPRARAFENVVSLTTREAAVAVPASEIVAGIKARYTDMTAIISAEMGAPIKLSREQQAAGALAHFQITAQILETFEFDRPMGNTTVTLEPVGVCGMITPWNWPANQVACKVAPRHWPPAARWC